jgi:ribosome-associated protein
VTEVEVGPEGIRLGRLLKFVGAAESGGEAKALLEAGEVRVNDVVETRRGAQLGAGDVVEAGGRSWRLV